MTAYQIGYLAVAFLIAIAVPTAIAIVGYLRTRGFEADIAQRRMRPYLIATWIVTFPLMAWPIFSLYGFLDTEPSIDEIMAGVDSGCRSSCVAQDTLTAAECDAYCACMSEPLRLRLADDPSFLRGVAEEDLAVAVEMVRDELGDQIQACLPTSR